MLDGKWGSGKTHLIEALRGSLDELFVPNESRRPLYVSLYGVTDTSAIGEQLYQQLHPALASKGMRLAGAVMKGLLKTTVKIDLSELHKGDLSLGSQMPDLKVSELLGGAKSRVIIFDDFERARMNPVEVLAYINPLVEHDGCKVIILANQEEVSCKDEYERKKEKTVGQTFVIVPDVEMAIETFLDQIDTPTLKHLLVTNRREILQIFDESGLGNLRLLKQFLWDFERFYGLLEEEYRKNEEAMLRICRFLLASSLELRSRRIALQEFGIEQISVFMKRRHAEKEEAKPKVRQMDDVARQYPTVDFSGELLTFDCASQIIMMSTYNMTEIHRQMHAHPLFTPVESLPSWRALWFSYDQPDSDIPSIVSRFEADFAVKRDYDENEVPHIVGLGLWLSDIGQPGWSKDDIETRLKTFVDEVYAGRPQTASEAATSFSIDRTMNGSLGLQFKRHDDPRFIVLCTYLETKAASWREACMPRAAEHLLSMLDEGDIEGFAKEIYLAPQDHRGLYVSVPILRFIPLDRFLTVFASLSPPERREILKAFSQRYYHLTVYQTLLDEEDWINKLKCSLSKYANNLLPIPGDSLRQSIKYYLDQLPAKFAATRVVIEERKLTLPA